MSKYKQWMSTQSPHFIAEICRGRQIPDMFVDYGLTDITLDDLKTLDEKYINPRGVNDNE